MSDERACDLCGLDVGARPFCLQAGGKTLKFCCDGCLGIYRMLHESELREAPGDSAPADEPPNKTA
ncbi:metal-binding protein [Parasulfuritortus cantonensis]|uniref:Metal-binding protein n=1 Tax=Parasulfuritortus cantonensis TaxID=2528202 RepID=A0A4R1B602_9PROT|nr:heavy metal translocating P-type ATPase metal-binding domain-containing protein [Parasulfuritortus cantonensis]TCJ11628.1 metal-binding protein [Parasulfuritortus cantonensis]